MSRRSEVMRVDTEFRKIMKDAAAERIKNNIDTEFRKPREMTKMLRRAPSFKNVLEELKTLPRKEDLE